jgi:exopolysaccharide biosynthesis protein
MIKISKYVLITITVIFVTMFCIQPSSADSTVIHEQTSKSNITSGVTLQNIKRFTINGWVDINVLYIDMSNKYVDIDVLTNPDDLKTLATVKSLAYAKNAVASINASFFDSAGNGTGYPIGPLVQSGKIINASNYFNKNSNNFSSFSIENNRNILYNYWRSEITIKNSKGQSVNIERYNSISTGKYSNLAVVDCYWGNITPGVSEQCPDPVEMVVINNNVVQIRKSMPGVTIPENGYVLVTSQKEWEKISGIFKTGEKAEMNITTVPAWENMKMSVSGGSILVKDGAIPSTFSFGPSYISDINPRTAIGSTMNGSKIILVTVDGRQNSSIGMTQTEIAELMLELGCYNALNLDGGGSSTMVVRKPGIEELIVVNNPSDGSPRALSTAIGVFSNAPEGQISGLIIENENENVFVKTSIKFNVRGYDNWLNPVKFDESKLTWSVSGIKGHFDGSTFYPESVGDGKITARLGSISSSVVISSLSNPVELELSSSKIRLSCGETKTINIKGINRYGYGAKINGSDVNWTVSNETGIIENGVFTAQNTGSGYIEAKIGSVKSYCAVSVASDEYIYTDSFENNNAIFSSYPDSVMGSYETTNEKKHSGNNSGKLSYDFTQNTEITRAAYINFLNNGIELKPSTSRIGMWVYNSVPSTNWFRGEVIDTNGTSHPVNFATGLDWNGWKYVEVSFENETYVPALLKHIYLVQFHPVKDSGEIYIDDLSIISSIFEQAGDENIPENTKPFDKFNISVTYKKTQGSFRFSVFGISENPVNPLEKLILLKMTEKINKYIDTCAFLGSGSHTETKFLQKPFFATTTGYKSQDISNSRLIQLDVSKGGIRLSNNSQWHWLFNKLETFNGDNIFIFLEKSPDNFIDSLEADLFKETLTQQVKKKNINIWVFYKGNKNASRMERGVKYIQTAGFNTEEITPKNTDAAKYVLVTVMENGPVYEFKPVID